MTAAVPMQVVVAVPALTHACKVHVVRALDSWGAESWGRAALCPWAPLVCCASLQWLARCSQAGMLGRCLLVMARQGTVSYHAILCLQEQSCACWGRHVVTGRIT